MPAGGKRKGAGRKRTKANVVASAKNSEIVSTFVDSGEATPLEIMLSVMTQAWKQGDTRAAFAAANAAAPYVHPRLASTELKGDPTKPQLVPTFHVHFAEPNDPRFKLADTSQVPALIPPQKA